MKNFSVIVLSVLSLAGCQTVANPSKTPPDNAPIIVKKPSEQRLCTMQYDPVCGKVENASHKGVFSYKTYGNACSASNSGDHVVSYTKGACGANQ